MSKNFDYSQFLPSVYRQSENEAQPFIERFLKVFQEILSGIEDSELIEKKGIAEILDIIADLFYPRFSFLYEANNSEFLPSLQDKEALFHSYFDADIDDFLKWFAGWMALILKEDWDIQKKRQVIAKIISIYRMRGTKKGLEEYLKIYVGSDVTIADSWAPPFEVGVRSTVGIDTGIGGDFVYSFLVYISFPHFDVDLLKKKIKAVREIINLEKPAHTYYQLKILTTSMQVEVVSTVGKDTIVG